MTAYGAIDSAMRGGAARRLPLRDQAVQAGGGGAGRWSARSPSAACATRTAQLRRAVDERLGFRNLIGKSAAMQQLYDLLERVAPTLVAGAGARRERAPARSWWRARCTSRGRARARAVRRGQLRGHARDRCSRRSCSATCAGAFTGATDAAARAVRRGRRRHAVSRRDRRHAAAAAGQAPARARGRRGARPSAATCERKVDVRIVAATNRDLGRACAQERFAKISTIGCTSSRSGCRRCARARGHSAARRALPRARRRAQPDVAGARGSTREALRRWSSCRWPGNVRELENARRAAGDHRLRRDDAGGRRQGAVAGVGRCCRSRRPSARW